MLRRWCDQATAANQILRACEVHAHLAYLFAHLPQSEFTPEYVTQLIASNIFLTTRYVYDIAAENGAMYGRTDAEKRGLESGLGIPDTEMFDIFQNRRAYILDYLNADQERANEVLDEVVKIITMGDEVRVFAALVSDRREVLLLHINANVCYLR